MKLTIVVALSTLILSSCASKKIEKQELQQKAEQSKVTDAKALGGTIEDLIKNSTTLTDAQKEEVTKIMELNKKTAFELTEQSYKYRAVLIEELLSGKSTKRRIKILENDIKRIERAKLKNTFDTVRKISSIISKEPDNQKYSEQLILIDSIRR